jgi:hypothetical protein
MDFILTSLVSALISVFTAFAILGLEEWRNKKKLLRALNAEIGSNLSLVKKLLTTSENLKGTVFDLQSLYVSSYEDFRRSGHLLSLNQETRELLEEVYKLTYSHNSQTEVMKNQQIDFSSTIAMIGTLAPRSGGSSERLKALAVKLQLLQQQL